MGVKVRFVTPSWNFIAAGHWNDRRGISIGSMTPTCSPSVGDSGENLAAVTRTRQIHDQQYAYSPERNSRSIQRNCHNWWRHCRDQPRLPSDKVR
ncbi:hypothetical protein NKH89_34850 [Mesorhizobium sp. M0923]